MATRAETAVEPRRTTSALLALALARVVVPLWLLVGAILKLIDASPSHLPAALVKWLGGLGMDLGFVLRFSIGVELAVVGVMWLLPRLARVVGIAMLAAFLPVLVGDVLMGASSCGCFGAVEVHPALTITMDLGLLLGLWLLGWRVPALAMSDQVATRQVLAAGVWTVASFAVGFGLTGLSAAAPASASSRTDLPADGFYLPSDQEWIGRPWAELPLAAWVNGAPGDLAAGAGYLLFYRKDCEHCHELMELFFSGRLELPTTAIAVPERDGFPTEGELPFPCQECSTAELPAGVDWFLQTPVLVRLEDGVVACAAEVSAADPVCLR